TPLHRAAEDGHLELARLLVDHGADIEAQEEEGRTPLHLTAEGGHCEVARFLIDKGADVDSRDHKQQT
ncbi:ankyrin repeat-containing domain protein, partial [Schizophyllum amplum]